MSNKRDEKATYTQQEDNWTAHSEAFINMLTKRGILGDSKIDNEKIRNAQKEKKYIPQHAYAVKELQDYRVDGGVFS